MKRSIIFSAALLTATLTFGQESKTVTTQQAVETTKTVEVQKPIFKTNHSGEDAVLNPILEPNVDDGEVPTAPMSSPEVIRIRQMKMDVYPNPSRGLLKITLSEINSSIKAIEVFDLTGKIRYLESKNVLDASSAFELDISGLENGVYILRVALEENVLVERIVKRD